MTPEEIRKAWPNVETTLKSGDILMVRYRHSFFAKQVHKISKSYWNHMAIVLLPKQDLPIGGPLIIEAAFSGITIHQMRKYSSDFDRYDLGVIRIPDMTDEERENLAMKFILSSLDKEYDYIRLAGFIFGTFLSFVSNKLALKFFLSVTNREAFVCTTFVHRVIHEHSAHLSLSVDLKSDDPEIQEMIREEMIAPGDIAREPYLKWLFNKHD